VPEQTVKDARAAWRAPPARVGAWWQGRQICRPFAVRQRYGNRKPAKAPQRALAGIAAGGWQVHGPGKVATCGRAGWPLARR